MEHLEIISEEAYDQVIAQNQHHLEALKNIIAEIGEPLEGGLFYMHGTFRYHGPQAKLKQRNLYSLAACSTAILEVGVNGGHSCLVMLLANPKATIAGFDICDHKYVKPCVEYLNKNFGNRIFLIEGSSDKTLSNFWAVFPEKKFDLFHIDGSHIYQNANLDFFICRNMAHIGKSVVVFDDTMMKDPKALWEGYLNNGQVKEIDTVLQTHDLCKHSVGVYL